MTILQCRYVIQSDSEVRQLKTLSFIQAIPALIWLGLEANPVLYELSAAGSDGASPGRDATAPARLFYNDAGRAGTGPRTSAARAAPDGSRPDNTRIYY